jgi:hypothetical protein
MGYVEIFAAHEIGQCDSCGKFKPKFELFSTKENTTVDHADLAEILIVLCKGCFNGQRNN